MNTKSYLLAHAVRGPVLLITIGILFAIHQAGLMPFGKTWPLLVIVLGVMKLIERMAAPPVPPVPPYVPPPYAPPTYPQQNYGPPPPPPPPGGPRR